jgi:hypothetical protein
MVDAIVSRPLATNGGQSLEKAVRYSSTKTGSRFIFLVGETFLHLYILPSGCLPVLTETCEASESYLKRDAVIAQGHLVHALGQQHACRLGLPPMPGEIYNQHSGTH